MNDKPSRQETAQRIAEALMQNGFGERAVRLQLRGEGEKDLGGLSEVAVVETIKRLLP